MSKDKTIESIKYIMQHSPNNDRWNNIWIDERASEEEFHEIYNSLTESGFLVNVRRGTNDIPTNIDIIIHNALEKGLQDPIWGEVLTEIKTHRQNQIELPKAARSSKNQERNVDDNIPKIKNRPIDGWFVEDPDPTLKGKEAQMTRKADEERSRRKASLKKLRQELREKEEGNMEKAVEQAKAVVDILPKTSNVENIQDNTEVRKRDFSKVARSNSSR